MNTSEMNGLFSLFCVTCLCMWYTEANVHSDLVRKFIHGCPFAFPCAPPPCDNPVFGPHDCCGSCPDPEVTVAPVARRHLSNEERILPSKKRITLIRKSVLKQSEDSVRHVAAKRQDFTTTTPSTTTECPFPCTHHGYKYCYPLPCHIPCVDAVKEPGACCYECKNGPNCSYEGHVIPERQNLTLPSGDVAYCYEGGIYGGSVAVSRVTTLPAVG